MALLTLAMCMLALPSLFVAHNQEQVPASQANQSTAKFHRGAQAIAGQYIVAFHDDRHRAQIDSTAKTLANLHGGNLMYIYEVAIKGFAVQMSEQEAMALSPTLAPGWTYVRRAATLQTITFHPLPAAGSMAARITSVTVLWGLLLRPRTLQVRRRNTCKSIGARPRRRCRCDYR